MTNFRIKTLKHFNTSGHYHALTFSCYKNFPLLQRDRTRRWLLESLQKACESNRYELLAFVFMPDHVHLIVAPSLAQYDISRLLQSIKQPVAVRARNWLTENDDTWLRKLSTTLKNGKTRFHFWQKSGGYDRNITSEKVLRSTIHYIHANPVRKNFADVPTAWKWSSARWYDSACIGSIFEIIEDVTLLKR